MRGQRDTTRTTALKWQNIYTIDDEAELLRTLSEENINYVLYERGMYYDGVAAREDVIATALSLVFESEDGNYRLYRVE